MPITINDCARCSRPPDWGWDDMGDGHAELILYCLCRAETHTEASAEELNEAVEAWNELNPVSSRDTNDIGGHSV